MCTLKLSFSTLFAFLISSVLSYPTWGLAQGSLQGTWKTVEIANTLPDSSWTDENPLPGLFIFGKNHYSIMHAVGNPPRKLFADDRNRTDAETVAAYESFWANSGTYEISGSTITTRTIVAKNPNRMAENRTVEIKYKLDGDTLWLTFSRRSGGTGVYKCSRLE